MELLFQDLPKNQAKVILVKERCWVPFHQKMLKEVL